ncbi:thiol:disulfide interchange protein DsbA/DsbL [Methylobacillus flagellatus]|uniref:thiol:disulfide interchange protein DsbA/DsbL n=1 Tax=Methylobacillus flagellatus TaxID=405 RepID=UPI002853BC20|nr:thiol:disulfide interchange protein DsbA/DsbL [Methylobacillus flagellatus]MDR5172062.1 thiol:disulfide interchange protein DsbA/DsbL [Methylobacillus flagellatus]
MKKLLAALMLLVSATAMADPQLGNEFNQTAKTIKTDNPAKIEVLEIFWYGCPHCYHLEPSLTTWVKKLPQDVYFKRVPGVPRPDWAPAGKAFYALEALNLTEKLHNQLFDAIHKARSVNPTVEAQLIDWITKQGGQDRKKVEEAFNSFSTNNNVVRAMNTFRDSGATGVPAIIIDGRYITSSSMAGGNQNVLKVADYLIENVRKEKSGGVK